MTAIALVLVSAAQTQAQTPPAASPPPAVAPQPKPAVVRVALQTSEGAIVLELEKDRAPITTRNFLRYVDERRYDGQTFYRAVNIAENFGLIQAGVRVMKPGQKIIPPIAHEPTTQTGLSHQTGTVSMAHRALGTAQSDFFIVVGDMSSLDAQPSKPGDNQGFAAFGRVVEGMDVVMKILSGPINPALGAKDGMPGQMLANPIRITSARRVETTPKP
ncbi:peptidylprolyl isomerase [Sphingobium sp. DEHP117]|uniref:peptidylprolyl isomerase n=1 Tax=Sphingobium sp. DEHP117 TaxID=2993436 RepID=UPI0027D68B2F|nr:peptidylprolyl isomerase [Sphingobium sp. DEHP117]MDQ4421404.1 peptidylprolyl isomerase [Sphingobium sp. DEHP117]